MTLRNELNNAKKVLKNGTFKEKAEYIWEYYKWHIIVLSLILLMIGSSCYTHKNAKNYVLQGIILNSTAQKDVRMELEQKYITYSPIDVEKEAVFFDTNYYFSSDTSTSFVGNSYQTLQKMTAKVSAGEIDFVIGDLESMKNLAYGQYFYELQEIFTDELLKKYETLLLYYDKDFLEELNSTDIVFENSEPIEYPDPKRPELMAKPVEIFINVSECELLKSVYPYNGKELAIAFAVNGKNNEKALEFLAFLMK